jgi:hypothetical protein
MSYDLSTWIIRVASLDDESNKADHYTHRTNPSDKGISLFQVVLPEYSPNRNVIMYPSVMALHSMLSKSERQLRLDSSLNLFRLFINGCFYVRISFGETNQVAKANVKTSEICLETVLE